MKVKHLIIILSVVFFSSCTKQLDLNSIPNLPKHWGHVRTQGLDSRVGYFQSTEITLKQMKVS